MSHSGMDMGNSTAGAACQISMLWNWYTVDACFLASSWHIRDNGMFAASCIGVVLLVVSLEALRRIGKEYDAYLVRSCHRHAATFYPPAVAAVASDESARCCTPKDDERPPPTAAPAAMPPDLLSFRASPVQQLIRSFIHMATFGLAYIIMLLAMYFNGYIIISIIIGAFLGKFLCDWMVVKIPLGGRREGARSLPGGVEEPTVCCG